LSGLTDVTDLTFSSWTSVVQPVDDEFPAHVLLSRASTISRYASVNFPVSNSDSASS
jgi:hypothetical protein